MGEKTLGVIIKGIERMYQRLDILTRMLALNLVKDIQIQKDKIVYLSEAGLTNAQTAVILGTTSHTVKQRLYEARKGSHARTRIEPNPNEARMGGEETT